MPSRETMVAAQGRVERRVNLSADLLKALGITPDGYARIVLNAMVVQPELAECTDASMDAAILRSINMRMLPDGRSGAIVPFKGKAQFVPMINGQITLAHRATPGISLRVKLVYDGDHWNYSEGLYVTLEHTPNPDGSRANDDIIAAYAVANLPKSTDPMFEVMFRSDIDRHKAFSRTRRDDSPWVVHYGEMAKKTVLRQLLKRLPLPDGLGPMPHVDTDEFTDVEIEGYGSTIDADYSMGGESEPWEQPPEEEPHEPPPEDPPNEPAASNVGDSPF